MQTIHFPFSLKDGEGATSTVSNLINWFNNFSLLLVEYAKNNCLCLKKNCCAPGTNLYRLCCQSTKTIQEATLLHVLVTNTLDISIMLDMKKSNTTKELISVYLLITCCTKISIRKIFKPLNTKNALKIQFYHLQCSVLLTQALENSPYQRLLFYSHRHTPSITQWKLSTVHHSYQKGNQQITNTNDNEKF